LSSGAWKVLDVPVLDRGKLGAWDDYRVASPVVIKDADGRYRMWYLGCRLAMAEHLCGVGHASSTDGIVWEKNAQPVFVPPDALHQDNLEEIAVVKASGRYLLWYSVAAAAEAGRRHASVHLASSTDGWTWKAESQILEEPFEITPTIEHSVGHDGQRFHMWYVRGGETRHKSPLLVHLSSSDGKAWEPSGETALWSLQRDLLPIGRLAVEQDGGNVRAYFTRALQAQQNRRKVIEALTSSDAANWTLQPVEPDPFADLPERNIRVRSLTTMRDGEGLWFWMTLSNGFTGREQIGVAFRRGKQS
jgi:sucrose-6-phosphate hydrolase SacC (GH32 family)